MVFLYLFSFSELNEHIIQEHTEGIIDAQHDIPMTNVCSECNVLFEDASAYRKHVAEHRLIKRSLKPHHGKRRTVGVARVSELPSTSQSEKKKRGRSAKVNLHKCSHCDKSFGTKMLLDRHILIHTGMLSIIFIVKILYLV